MLCTRPRDTKHSDCFLGNTNKTFLIGDGLVISCSRNSQITPKGGGGDSSPTGCGNPQSRRYLLPGLHHARGVRQDVDVLVLVVLVDPGPGFEE